MKKAYITITDYGSSRLNIDHYSTFEDALKAYNQACEDDCYFCCLLETEVQYPSGDSVNKILSYAGNFG